MSARLTSRDQARQLRRKSTDAERRLWGRLRSRRLCGHKFRRQYPVGEFIADFACTERRLVIELDGGQHALSIVEDTSRTRFLNARGFRVLRFWNNDVMSEIDAVCEVIVAQLDEPSP
jgi:very-short-patch-repair endonuclease